MSQKFSEILAIALYFYRSLNWGAKVLNKLFLDLQDMQVLKVLFGLLDVFHSKEI